MPEFMPPEFIDPEFIEPELIEPEFIEPEFMEPEFMPDVSVPPVVPVSPLEVVGAVVVMSPFVPAAGALASGMVVGWPLMSPLGAVPAAAPVVGAVSGVWPGVAGVVCAIAAVPISRLAAARIETFIVSLLMGGEEAAPSSTSQSCSGSITNAKG